MKLFVLLLCFCSLNAWAQPNFGIAKKDSCYKAADARKKQRFAEYECGKVAGVVDCNEKLEMNAQNIIITKGGKMPFTGSCESCHMNGLLAIKVNFVNGRANGIDTAKYATGCLQTIRSHVNGVENGKWTYFFDSLDIPAWEKNYSLGNLHGTQITYAKRKDGGKLIIDTAKIETYANGVLFGPKVTFNQGKRMKSVNYVNGLLEGPFLIYNKDGVIIDETFYKEGKKHGVWKYYYEDGKLLRTENWNMDAKNGEFKSLYYDGSLQSIENYKKNNGVAIEYLTAKTYECSTEEAAKQVSKMLSERKTKAQIVDEIGASATVNVFEDKTILQEEKSYLKGKKLDRGVNKYYKLDNKFYVVLVEDIAVVNKKEYKEGAFEERFQSGKLKRKAIYKKDVLIEEHVYDEQGKEIKTFGGTAETAQEDDAMPTSGKGKKKKEKKSKKKKEK